MVGSSLLTAILMAIASLLYATVGQAGGTAFVAVMAFAAFPANEIRPTALTLNILAASYATWRLYHHGSVDWPLFRTLTLASVPAALVGGLVVLDSSLYLTVTAVLLLLAAVVMIFRAEADHTGARILPWLPVMAAGGATGFLSGLTGVGGGVFLAPLIIALGWTSPLRAAGLSPPFILVNSAIGLIGVLMAGQRPSPDVIVFAFAAVIGAAIGTFVGLRFMSQAAVRYVLAIILVVGSVQMLTTALRAA